MAYLLSFAFLLWRCKCTTTCRHTAYLESSLEFLVQSLVFYEKGCSMFSAFDWEGHFDREWVAVKGLYVSFTGNVALQGFSNLADKRCAIALRVYSLRVESSQECTEEWEQEKSAMHERVVVYSTISRVIRKRREKVSNEQKVRNNDNNWRMVMKSFSTCCRRRLKRGLYAINDLELNLLLIVVLLETSFRIRDDFLNKTSWTRLVESTSGFYFVPPSSCTL